MTESNRSRSAHPLVFPLSLVAFVTVASSPARASERGPFTGRWAFQQVTTTVAEVPVVGKVYATTTAISVHKLKHKGERLKGKGRLCKLDLDSGSAFVKTIMPAALLKALPPPRIDARLADESGGLHFSQARQTIVLGAKLDNPVGDALPRVLTDPRVFDQDEDGEPAVTVRVSGIVTGDIRVVQRSWTELVGERVSPERIEGSIRFGNEQAILDATASMLKSPPASTPDFARSRFKLVRLPDKATCSDAIAALRGGP
ncbi:MAG: hypothetical protein FJ096_17795 [Deltaproteobacteria bacterium]|nr:hypothetical protein [Deltaproteobacteria bacterium]